MNVGTQRAKRSPSRTRARGKRVVAPRPAFDLDAITPMEAKSVSQLPVDAGWQFEPKWDGFRCLAWKSEDAADLRGKSGKSLARYFPEVLESLSELVPECFCIDAELVIPIRGELSFDALQMRLHPAQSRIRRLSQSTPALLIVFDCLWGADGTVLLDEPLDRRREALEHLFDEIRSAGLLRLSPYTRERREAQRWLERSGGALDGVIAKRIEEPYRPGERAMLKIRQHHTVDCVVGGFRYAANSKEVGSLLLGLYDDEGLLHHVGFTSSIVARRVRLLCRAGVARARDTIRVCERLRQEGAAQGVRAHSDVREAARVRASGRRAQRGVEPVAFRTPPLGRVPAERPHGGETHVTGAAARSPRHSGFPGLIVRFSSRAAGVRRAASSSSP